MSIIIRAAEKSDYSAIAEIYDHPLVVEQSSQHPYLGKEKISKIFDQQGDNLILLVGVLDSTVAGYLGIHLNQKPRAKHVASVSMAVHPDYHGKGLGKALMGKAVELSDGWLNVVRLELSVYSDNLVAINLYQKFGFDKEGEARYASYKAGNYAHITNMARLKL